MRVLPRVKRRDVRAIARAGSPTAKRGGSSSGGCTTLLSAGQRPTNLGPALRDAPHSTSTTHPPSRSRRSPGRCFFLPQRHRLSSGLKGALSVGHAAASMCNVRLAGRRPEAHSWHGVRSTLVLSVCARPLAHSVGAACPCRHQSSKEHACTAWTGVSPAALRASRPPPWRRAAQLVSGEPERPRARVVVALTGAV